MRVEGGRGGVEVEGWEVEREKEEEGKEEKEIHVLYMYI